VSRDGPKRLHTCSMLDALTLLEVPACTALLDADSWVALLVRVKEVMMVLDWVVPSRPGSSSTAARPLIPACKHNAA
jgi:hypothetical protein